MIKKNLKERVQNNGEKENQACQFFDGIIFNQLKDQIGKFRNIFCNNRKFWVAKRRNYDEVRW